MSPVSATTPAMFWPKSKTCTSDAGSPTDAGGSRARWRIGSKSCDEMTAPLAAEVAFVAAAHLLSSKPAPLQPASAAATRAS